MSNQEAQVQQSREQQEEEKMGIEETKHLNLQDEENNVILVFPNTLKVPKMKDNDSINDDMYYFLKKEGDGDQQEGQPHQGLGKNEENKNPEMLFKTLKHNTLSDQQEDGEEEEGIINTSSQKNQQQKQTTKAQITSSSDDKKASGSYHMQQNLNISGQINKQFFDTVKKGDLAAIQAEAERIGINLAHLVDESMKHTPIFYAVEIKSEETAITVIQWLIQQGVDASAQDSLNQTALFYASRDGKIALAELLIQNGCEADHVDTYGQTSMFYAAREGQADACRILHQNGAQCNSQDNNGQTPLYYAVKSGKLDTVQFLIENGADVNHEDKKQQTPMLIAKRNNKQQIMNLLLENGAKRFDDLRKQPRKSRDIIEQPQLSQQNSIKKEKTTTTEKKQTKKYVLTMLRDNQWEPISFEDLAELEREYPNIAKYWKDPSNLETLPVPKFPENAPIYESWDKAAKRLINSLWKMNNARIFHEPVDAEKLDIPDYFDVIKKPMDFGSIKQRLNSNYYHRLQEFLDDVNLVFDNCFKFNGEDSHVGKMCRSVRDEFRKLFEQLNLEFYLN